MSIYPSPAASQGLEQDGTIPDHSRAASPKDFDSILRKAKESGMLRPVEGAYWTFASEERPCVFMKVGDGALPFYRSLNGTGGKTAGTWYPFFGKGERGWFVKGTSEDCVNGYGNPEIRWAKDWLNENLAWDRGHDARFATNKADHPLNALGRPVECPQAMKSLFGQEQFPLTSRMIFENAEHMHEALRSRGLKYDRVEPILRAAGEVAPRLRPIEQPAIETPRPAQTRRSPSVEFV